MALSIEQLDILYIQQWLIALGVDLFLTGIYTCMIFFILYFFCSNQRSRAQKSSKILTGVIILMCIIRTMHVGVFWFQNWSAFVKHGDSRNSVGNALVTPPDLKWSDVTSILLTAIADSVMVWRCWIISGSSIKVTLLPFLLNLLAIVFGIVYISFNRPGDDVPPMAILMSTMNLAFSVATITLSTLIIAIRILMAGKVPGDTGARNRYSKPLAIIIESSTLYTVSFIIYIPFWAITNDFTDVTFLYVEIVAQNMTVITPALIMLRVLISKHSNSQPRSKLTTLRFEHDDGSRGDQNNSSTTSYSGENHDEGVEIWQSGQSEKEAA